ncbi:MAG TPA: CidA/LrgA family protein [Burkholderiales bacterium]|nr:CidA/LrgA family protein [Burkholderiales bacterium]
MLGALTILLVFQLIGETISHVFDLPVPGPVIGFMLLLVALAIRGHVPAELRTTATGMLQHFALMFVPAGVGVMVHLSRLRDEWFPIVVSLVLSTVLTIACTALVMRWLMRRFADKGQA